MFNKNDKVKLINPFCLLTNVEQEELVEVAPKISAENIHKEFKNRIIGMASH